MWFSQVGQCKFTAGQTNIFSLFLDKKKTIFGNKMPNHHDKQHTPSEIIDNVIAC